PYLSPTRVLPMNRADLVPQLRAFAMTKNTQPLDLKVEKTLSADEAMSAPAGSVSYHHVDVRQRI
ncbi:hypothetical protein J8J22_23390, partial [Mycobacterium tuberculosis]|nr:hypothetical protein [Mycobacterium tuberculosis]